MTRTRWLTTAFTVCLVTFGAVAGAEDAPDNWDGLVQIKPRRMDLVHVLPGADFRPYTKVMLDNEKIVVGESMEQVVDRAIEFGRRLRVFRME